MVVGVIDTPLSSAAMSRRILGSGHRTCSFRKQLGIGSTIMVALLRSTRQAGFAAAKLPTAAWWVSKVLYVFSIIVLVVIHVAKNYLHINLWTCGCIQKEVAWAPRHAPLPELEELEQERVIDSHLCRTK